MDEREQITNGKDADVERSSEDIRQDIAKGEETLSQTVDQIGERIKETLDWREYIRESPYLAMGAAVGAGYLASQMFPRRVTTPMERIMDAMVGHGRDALGGVIVGAAGPSLIKATLLGIVTKAAAAWIKNAIATAGTSDGAGHPQAGRDSSSEARRHGHNDEQ